MLNLLQSQLSFYGAIDEAVLYAKDGSGALFGTNENPEDQPRLGSIFNQLERHDMRYRDYGDMMPFETVRPRRTRFGQDLIEDIDHWLEGLAPFRKDYKHHDTGEDNGDSHLKALLIHHEVIVPITAGKLDLGTWQRIFYAEFDGQRD